MSVALEEIILGQLGQIQQELAFAQLQATADANLAATNAVLTQVNAAIRILTDPTYGLAALQAQLATFQATTATDVTAILTAIGTPAQTGVDVGVDSLSIAAIASAVWGFTVRPATVTAEAALSYVYSLIYAADQAGGFQYGYSPYVKPLAGAGWEGSFPFNTDTPQPDPRNILGTDTLVSWLTRELPAWNIDTTTYGGLPIYIWNTNPNSAYFCVLDEVTFSILKAALVPSTTVLAAPIWPGIANVTLGTPVALAAGVTITAPMDGVLITITGYPSKQGFFTFDGILSIRNAGALAFFTDNADEEFPQTLGFTDAVYCPKSMQQAAGVVVRTAAGITGTIQPWTRNT